MARGTRIRLVLAFPLVAALILTGCGVLGSNGNGTVCPAPTLEPVAAPSAGGGSVTYGFLIDRAGQDRADAHAVGVLLERKTVRERAHARLRRLIAGT